MKFLIQSSSPAQIFTLQALIHSQPGWRVVGSLHSPGDILAATGRTHPDIIILDLDGEMLAGDLLCTIQLAAKRSALIILGMDPELRRQVESAGAGHFFNKAYTPESLLAVLSGCEMRKPENPWDGFRLA